MLGILLLYWIGKYFYKLAEEHDRSKWGFAVLGIITYYVGTFLFGIILGIVTELISPGFVESIDDMTLSFIVLPFGILSCYIFYKLLENSWKEDLKGPSTTDFIQRN